MKTITYTTFTMLAGLVLALPACAKDRASSPAPGQHTATAAIAHEQVVKLSVTSDGFVPASFAVHAGHHVKLVVTRKVERTCATDIVIKDLKISAALPLNKAVELTFTPTKPGKIRFACAMDMIAGEIVVE